VKRNTDSGPPTHVETGSRAWRPSLMEEVLPESRIPWNACRPARARWFAPLTGVAVHESMVTVVQSRAEIQHGPCQCKKQLDVGDYRAGVEVSESAVSVPRRESPTTALRIAERISVAPISKVMSGGT